MALLLKNAHVVDPQVSINRICDIIVRDGKIVEVGQEGESLSISKGQEIDLQGQILIPGMVDIHVHLREPGKEYKEDIESGTRAAAHGGYTAVCTMPNTTPVTDTAALVSYQIMRAREKGYARVHPIGAITQGLKGLALSEMGEMAQAGACAFSDDGRGVQEAGVLRLAMDYAVPFNRVLISHCEDESIVGTGCMNEGKVSTYLGVTGWPAAGEEVQIDRDIALARLTGARLHIAHITTARGVESVTRARTDGLPVSCEVTPHHLFLCEEDIDTSYSTHLKMNPPLRTRQDMEKLQAALIRGDIDCVATDHAPHAPHEKAVEFELAPFGIIGLETALGLVYTNLVASGKMSLERFVEVMSINPRTIVGLEPVRIEAGCTADFTVFDPNKTWVVSAQEFESKSKNSPFIGWELQGKPTYTFVGGYPSMVNTQVVDERDEHFYQALDYHMGC